MSFQTQVEALSCKYPISFQVLNKPMSDTEQLRSTNRAAQMDL